MSKRISILAPNLSQNNLGRAYLLARVLQRAYEVEIVGPVFQDRIWPPVDDGRVPYLTAPGRHFPLFLHSANTLLRHIRGDVVYAVKPRLTSFGLGLIHQQRTGKPLILDIDDWDAQGEYTASNWWRTLRSAMRLANPYSHQYLRLMERYIPRADAITVVSTTLQAQFGGIIVPHGRDTAALDPALFDQIQLRAQHNLHPDHFVLMFLGTPRPHKGLEELISAVNHLEDANLRLMIVGVDPQDPYTQTLQAQTDARTQLIGFQPWDKIPQFLAIADAIVLAQRELLFSQAQVPAKVFDAMSMAKPVIATAVGDLPYILADSGLLIPPENPAALQQAILTLRQNPALAQTLGQNGRRRCQAEYSWDVMFHVLDNLIQTLLARP